MEGAVIPMRAELLVLLEGSNVIENCAKGMELLILAMGNKTIKKNYVDISSSLYI